MDREAWSATALGVAKSQTRLERLPRMHARAHTHTHTHSKATTYMENLESHHTCIRKDPDS